MYRIIKVLNNNGILVLDVESRREVILLGNGIGFGHRTGERIESTGQAKRYELVTGSPRRFSMSRHTFSATS